MSPSNEHLGDAEGVSPSNEHLADAECVSPSNEHLGDAECVSPITRIPKRDADPFLSTSYAHHVGREIHM